MDFRRSGKQPGRESCVEPHARISEKEGIARHLALPEGGFGGRFRRELIGIDKAIAIMAIVDRFGDKEIIYSALLRAITSI